MSDQTYSAYQTLPSPRRLKQLAASLRKANPSISQLDALTAVARQSGWSSYKTYYRAWEDGRSVPRAPSFEVSLAASWNDVRTSSSGTETAYAFLSQPWWEFLTLEQRRSVSAVSRFRIDGKDRTKLISKSSFATPTNARHYAKKAARALIFIDILRVVPASWRTASEELGIDVDDWRFPAGDHELAWHDPAKGAYFLTNEPYQEALTRNADGQHQWLKARGLCTVALSEGSIHNPPFTALQFIGKASQVDSLRRCIRQLSIALATVHDDAP